MEARQSLRLVQHVASELYDRHVGVYFKVMGGTRLYMEDELEDVTNVVLSRLRKGPGARVFRKEEVDEDEGDGPMCAHIVCRFPSITKPGDAVIVEQVRRDLKDKGLCVEAVLIHNELDCKAYEWSVGMSCEMADFYELSDVLNYLPRDKACVSYSIEVKGLEWAAGEMHWDDDVYNGAAGVYDHWKLLRDHVFCTHKDGVLANFNWLK